MTVSTTPEDEARIENLESRLAHQDLAIQELSNEVYRQQRQLADLEALVRELRGRLEPLELAQLPGSPRDEMPPHY